MDINKLNNTLLYSNKNVEKTARKLINESSNAVLMEMFEDRCILADHTTGQIFEAKYSFDGNIFEFKDFEEITLEQSTSSLKEAISDYFDDSNISLTESYEKAIASKSDVFEDSLTEALASKNMESVIDYADLIGINEEIGDLKNNNTFKLYKERLNEKPTNSIKVFDWKNPVKVALLDEDVDKTINKSTINKAKKLRGNVDFRKKIMEAATDSLNGDNNKLSNLISENTCLLALDDAGFKELIGMSLVTDKKLMENRNNIFETIQNIISEDAVLSERKNFFTEEEEEEKNASSKTDAPEANEEDVSAIVKALEKAKELAKDEKLINKIDNLISSLESSSADNETDVAAVKESIELLSL